MRVVLDTNIVIAAIRSATGASAALLKAILFEGRGVMLVSTTLLFEYEATGTMPQQLVEAGATREQVVNLINAIARVAEPVRIDYRWRPLLLDPADEMVLEAAVNGRADMIVTFNLRDFGNSPAQFGIETVRPADALTRMMT